MLTIIHISDLHISERLLDDSSLEARLPHRYGHSVSAFVALDHFLRTEHWDLLLITGDISRAGRKQSFEWVRNWLENEITLGNQKVGLNISKDASKRYIVIPGNHDRFDGNLVQDKLDNYHREFPEIGTNAVESFSLQGIDINVHLFDSTYEDGGFALGRIDPRALVPKTLYDEHLDLALLHHHFLQPPKHPREIQTELINSSDVAAYMLNAGFDAVFFGHTHKGYIGRPSVEIMGGLLSDKRKRPRFWKKIMPKYFLRKQEEGLVSYKREAAQNGQYPTLASYFDFLYLKQKGFEVFGPASFPTIRHFYDQMRSVRGDDHIERELKRVKEKRMLVSLAPSACQAEARWNGFHVIHIDKDLANTFSVEWDRFQYDGASFKKMDRTAHVS